MPSPQQLFYSALSLPEKQALAQIATHARQAAPLCWTAWYCGTVHVGYVSAQRAVWLSGVLQGARLTGDTLVWDSVDCSAEQRSAQLQSALERARAAGILTGWRNERFTFWDCTQGPNTNANACLGACQGAHLPPPDTPHFFSVERSGFRFLGVMSHAVHINGFRPDGYLWCGRRALSKPTDPGMLDNVTAGGLPSGESVLDCAVRELEEEAGLTGLALQSLQYAGAVRTARVEPQGYHDELLQVFSLTLPEGCVPANRDGEVSEFVCLSPAQVMARIARGEFTADAAASLAQGLAGLTHS